MGDRVTSAGVEVCVKVLELVCNWHPSAAATAAYIGFWAVWPCNGKARVIAIPLSLRCCPKGVRSSSNPGTSTLQNACI